MHACIQVQHPAELERAKAKDRGASLTAPHMRYMRKRCGRDVASRLSVQVVHVHYGKKGKSPIESVRECKM